MCNKGIVIVPSNSYILLFLFPSFKSRDHTSTSIMSFLATSQTEPTSPSEISEISLTASVSASPKLHNDHSHESNHNFIIGSSPAAFAGVGPADDVPSAVNMVIRQDPFTITLDAHALLAGCKHTLVATP